MKSPGFFRRTIDTIQNHFFLRNIVLALCIGIVAVYLTGLLLKAYTRHGQKQEVPNFVGSTPSEARPLASSAKLRLEVIDSIYIPKQRPGMIVDQSPKAGMNVKSGRRVLLTVNSYRPKMEVIPYVTGYSLRQAKNTLESKGFEIQKLVYRDDMATNNVLAQSYNGKEIVQGSEIKAELGSGVTLTVGRNPDSPLPVVPKVIGLTLREAKSRLWEIGLNIGEVRNGDYGNKDTSKQIDFFGIKLGFAVKAKENTNISQEYTPYKIFGRDIPIGVIKTTRQEIIKTVTQYDKETAAIMLEQQVIDYENTFLGDAAVLSRTPQYSGNDEMLQIKMVYKIEGEIGKESELFIK